MEARSIPLPSLERQQEFEARFEAIARTAKVAESAIGEADTLFASLQHRAFRGEL
jgi:type I restriction enzyme S subunit